MILLHTEVCKTLPQGMDFPWLNLLLWTKTNWACISPQVPYSVALEMVLRLPDPFPPMFFRHFLALSDSFFHHLSPHMAGSGLGIYKIAFKYPFCSPKLFYLLWENQISTINVKETDGIKPAYSGWLCYMDSQASSTFYKNFQLQLTCIIILVLGVQHSA